MAYTQQQAQQYYNTLTPDQKAAVDASGGASVEWFTNAVNAGVPLAVKAAGGTENTSGWEIGGGYTLDWRNAAEPSTWLGQRAPTPSEVRKWAHQTGNMGEDFERFSDRQVAAFIQDGWDVQRGGFFNKYGDKVGKPIDSGPSTPKGMDGLGQPIAGFGGGGRGGGGGTGGGGGGDFFPNQSQNPLQQFLESMLKNQGSFMGEYDPIKGDEDPGIYGGAFRGGGVWWAPGDSPGPTAPLEVSGFSAPAPAPVGGGQPSPGLQGVLTAPAAMPAVPIPTPVQPGYVNLGQVLSNANPNVNVPMYKSSMLEQQMANKNKGGQSWFGGGL